MNSSSAIIKEFLNDAGTNALRTFLGGGYVTYPVLPAGFSNSHKAIQFQRQTEQPHISSDHQLTTNVFKCYGGSRLYSDADAVARKLFERLMSFRSFSTSAGMFMMAEPISLVDGVDDPETAWPVSIATFYILTS